MKKVAETVVYMVVKMADVKVGKKVASKDVLMVASMAVYSVVEMVEMRVD